MQFEFKFPDVGEGIHEGRIVEWLVAAGDTVEEDQSFIKVETDKAVVDLPAPKAGTVLALNYKKGDTIHVGDVIAVFGTEGEKVEDLAVPAESEQEKVAREAVPRASAAAAGAPSAGQRQAAPGRALATPHTRAYARRMGVDLKLVEPTGKGGRVTDEDVDRAAKGERPKPAASRPAQAARAVEPAAPLEITEEGPVERRPMSHLRKVIADAMALSKRTSPHVTHVDEADVTDLVALYQRIKPTVAAEGVKLSLTALFIKGLVAVLKRHPLLNASYDEAKNEVVLKKYYNIGVAVDTPEGLIVPVIKDADKKDLLQIAEELADLALRARERRLNLDELRGGTFTITNIGPIGGLLATPIIHQPELAIAAFFAVKERPAVVDGAVVPRKMMNVAISFDHRIIDGAEGARAASALVNLLENPDLLLLRL